MNSTNHRSNEVIEAYWGLLFHVGTIRDQPQVRARIRLQTLCFILSVVKEKRKTNKILQKPVP